MALGRSEGGGDDPSRAAPTARVAIWAFHGDRDTVVPPHASRVMIKALRDAGAKPRYDELENVGHLCWDRAYATEELWDWLFAQKRGEKPAPAPAR